MIVNDEQRRALEYVATVNRGGWRPTGREINEWRLRPDPKPARKGKLLEPGVPAVPERRVRVGGSGNLWGSSPSGLVIRNVLSQALQAQLHGLSSAQLFALNPSVFQAIRPLMGEYEIIPGKPGRPAVYGPDRPQEKFLAHLRRLGWIERDRRGRYAVTQLGHALLRAEASAGSEDEESSVMVLEADDELAYGQVLGVVAECGDALVVDAYLGTDQLAHLLKHTNACRFLVGRKLNKARVAELSVLIELTPPDPDGPIRELRQADFHDRWLIGEHHVYGLGSSLNGVGKAATTLVQMPDGAAYTIRSQAEHLWDDAEVIAQTRPISTGDDEEDDDQDSRDVVADATVREVDGAFLHGNCTTRHRSVEAARRCTKSRLTRIRTESEGAP